VTRTIVRPVSTDPEAHSSDPFLAALLSDIAELGLHARVRTEWVAGEPDVRVEIRRDGGAAVVELLGAGPDATSPPHVDAVRIQDGERAVWQGCHIRWAAPDLVRFLCDLLLLDVAALHRRYRLLG
jgi:hypothetical protein